MADAEADPDADPESVARTIGLAMLDRAPRTRAELATAMARRGVPDDAAETVLDRFEEVGLGKRGIDADIASDALSSVSTDDEALAAEALVRRRLPSMSGLSREVQTRRLVAMLGRKGFGGSLAYGVVRRVVGQGSGSLDAGSVAP
jgi:regulatory protein